MLEKKFSSSNAPENASNSQRIAPVLDRFLAFVFDVVIFTPVFSFLLADIFRKLELVYFTSPESTEMLVLCGVVFFFAMLLTIITHSFFLVYMGATPGKYFFKLKVISLSENDIRLSMSQALLRSFLWALEFLFLCFPFLEIFSQSERRPLHDKAAGTMLVTLKNKADPGPQVSESRLVRRMLLAIGVTAFCWGTVKVARLYEMALKGEFKQADLEANDFLCSQVSQTVKARGSRLDQALALYLADEISESCLNLEIDFALWKADDQDKAWAYLAKGITKKSDRAQFEAYLEKACDLDEESSACQIAYYEADPKTHPLPILSQTALVLRSSQEFEEAHYQEAQKLFVKLSKQTGFDNYSKQGIVKVFWAQNQLEKARGAYENVIHQMSSSQKREMAAWICHEELDRNCSSQSISACEDLRKDVQGEGRPVRQSFIGLALLREKQCRKISEDQTLNTQDLLKNKKDLADYVSALSMDLRKNSDGARQIFQELAFRKESVQPSFLRRMALQQWAGMAKDDKDFSKLIQFLKDKKVRDLSWIKIYENSVSSMIRMRSEKSLRETVSLPTDLEVSTYQLQGLQIQAYYWAHDLKKAWAVIQSQTDGSRSRAPASLTKAEIGLAEIQNRLSAQFGKKIGKDSN